MDLDLVFLHQTSIDKELRNVLPLITLKLDNLSQLQILHNSTIATEFFLEIFENFIIIVILPKTLNCSQALSSIPLLYTNVYIILCTCSNIFCFRILEWVCDIEKGIRLQQDIRGQQRDFNCQSIIIFLVISLFTVTMKTRTQMNVSITRSRTLSQR